MNCVLYQLKSCIIAKLANSSKLIVIELTLDTSVHWLRLNRAVGLFAVPS